MTQQPRICRVCCLDCPLPHCLRAAVPRPGRGILTRKVLVYEGQEKAVLYNDACEIDVDGLVSTLSLDVRGLEYDATRIEPELQAIADEIVGSFLLNADEAEP